MRIIFDSLRQLKRVYLFMNGLIVDGIADRYISLARTLNEARLKVFVQSTVFVRRQAQRNSRIAELNSRMQSYCAGGCIYIDLNSTLARDGILDAAFTLDGTHISSAAYEKWREIVSNHFRKCDPASR